MLSFVELSLRENLFWLDIMREHAIFMRAGFPCDAKELIQEAIRFEQRFGEQLNKVGKLHEPTERQVEEINQQSIALVNEFINFKTRVLDLLVNCRLGGFNFPLLIVHIRREAVRFAQILKQLNAKVRPGYHGLIDSVVLDEVFWTLIMAEHAKFISHLLDPSMDDLIATANDFAAHFDKLSLEARKLDKRIGKVGPKGVIRFSKSLIRPTVDIRNFKAAAKRLIDNCEILSLISSELADHVRREADKFLEDLDDHIADLQKSSNRLEIGD